jgi:hypothetical protein
MLKMSRSVIILILIAVVCLFIQGCSAPEKVVRESFLSAELLGRGGLEIVWENQLPIKKDECLERMFVLGSRVYGLSDRNYMVSLNRRNGTMIFSRDFAGSKLPIYGLDLYKGMLVSVVGSELVELNSDLGIDIRRKNLGLSLSSQAVRNQSRYYLPCSDRRLRVLRAADMVKLFEVSAENNSLITSVAANDEFVIFTTRRGNVISIAADSPKRLWQFNAAGSVVGPTVMEADSLVFASKDTNVYMIDIHTGQLIWKRQTAAILEDAPIVTADTVYQFVQGHGLMAINKKNGKMIWQLPEGLQLLAQTANKAYIAAKNGMLVVMDNVKAKKLWSINMPHVERFVTNHADSKIYVADISGRIACLKPIR